MAQAPISVAVVSGVAATAVASRVRGQLYVTVVAKGTFELRPDQDMALAPPEPLVTREQHNGGSPSRSVRATSELAPYLPAAEVLFVGHAHAPSGATVHFLDVRLAVWGERLLVDKTLRVEATEPFAEIPIAYERAYGGVGFPENPLGTGRAPGSPPPNVIDPLAPEKPVGLGPIAEYWPARKRLLKPGDVDALRGPVHEMPDGFDWSYFLASPADQRAPYFAGNEWVLLENLLRGVPQMRSRLPDVRALTRIRWTRQAEAGAPSFLHADTLRIDGDTGRCMVVFRGVFPLPEGARLEDVRPAVALSIAGAEVDWTSAELGGPSVTAPVAAGEPGAESIPLGGTLEIPPPQSNASLADLGATLPFASRPKGGARAEADRASTSPLAGTPWAGASGASGATPRPAPRPSSNPLAITLAMDEVAMGKPVAQPRPVPVVSPAVVTAGPAIPPAPLGETPPPSNEAPPIPRTSPPREDASNTPARAPRPSRAPEPQQPAGPAAVLTPVKKGGYDRFKH